MHLPGANELKSAHQWHIDVILWTYDRSHLLYGEFLEVKRWVSCEHVINSLAWGLYNANNLVYLASVLISTIVCPLCYLLISTIVCPLCYLLISNIVCPLCYLLISTIVCPLCYLLISTIVCPLCYLLISTIVCPLCYLLIATIVCPLCYLLIATIVCPLCYHHLVFWCALKYKHHYFDEIVIRKCTGNCQNGNFQCSQWWQFYKNDNSNVSVYHKLLKCKLMIFNSVTDLHWSIFDPYCVGGDRINSVQHSLYHGYWCPRCLHCQDIISTHDIDFVE